MFIQDVVLSLIVFTVAPPLLFGLRYLAKRLRTATRDAVILNSHVLGAMQETVQGISIVKAFHDGETTRAEDPVDDRCRRAALQPYRPA